VRAAIAALALLTAAAGLGVWLGALYLRRERKPAVVGAHLLLGAAGLELTVVMLRGSPDGEVVAADTISVVAAALLAAAMATGFVAPLIGKHSRQSANVALVTHVLLGIAGYGAFAYWLLSV